MCINFKKFNSETGLIILLVFSMILFSFFDKSFFTLNNMFVISSQMVEISLLSIAISICMISGEFDFSIASLTGLGSVCLSYLLTMEYGIWIGVIVTFIVVVAGGLLNGFLIGYLKFNSMIVTLGTSSLYVGFAFVISKGTALSGLPEEFLTFGQGYIGIIPVQVVILLLVAAISLLLLNFTKYGRKVYLIGSNYRAAKYSGINVRLIIMSIYIFSSILCFVASIIITSRFATGRADLASSLLIKSITATILGGISISGGIGNIANSILAAFILTLIANGLNMVNVSSYFQNILIGTVLIVKLIFSLSIPAN